MRISVKMWFEVLVASAVVVSALGQQGEFASDCPTPNGFFSDAVQCDKYYECVDDVLTEKLCPDGMGFIDLNPKVEKCDFLFQVDCSERPELQPAKSTPECPRQNGYFPMADDTICDKFHYCAGGVGNLVTCPEALVFNLGTGTCVWPEQAGRENCVSEKVLNFTCPGVGLDKAIAHPRYADPADCQYFYVCINGRTPRRNGCTFGEVFNSDTATCGAPTEVPECSDYYTEYFENYFSTSGGNSGQVSADIIAAAITSGFHVPNLTDRKRIQTSSSRSRGTTPPPGTFDAKFFKPSRGAVGLPNADGSASKPIRNRGARPSSSAGTSETGLKRRRPGANAAAVAATNTGGIRSSAVTSETGLKRRRPGASRAPTQVTATRTGGIRTRLTTSPPPTTPPPATTAAPPAVDDYVYYDDAAYYDDYPADEGVDAAAPAPAEAPARTSSFRQSLVRPRN